jgi:hypothetical protein
MLYLCGYVTELLLISHPYHHSTLATKSLLRSFLAYALLREAKAKNVCPRCQASRGR